VFAHGDFAPSWHPSGRSIVFTSWRDELSRLYTGKPKFLKFHGHFHGWHDQVAAGGMSHFDGSAPPGIPQSIVGESILLPTDDVKVAVDTLASRADIAAVIVEPSGASWGQVPLPPGFLAALREATRRHRVLLVFDEVITGFRWSRGGAQARYGTTPDLTMLAKILAGGLPGGAVAGAKNVLDQIDAAAAKAAGREKVGHQGTFNANPLSAAAAVATLSLLEEDDACERAEATAGELRAGLRRVLIDEEVPWGVYGETSCFVIFPNPGKLPIDPATFDPLKLGFQGIKGARNPELINRLRIALLAHGVDIAGGPGGYVSAAHGSREIAQTLEAFRSALRALRRERAL